MAMATYSVVSSGYMSKTESAMDEQCPSDIVEDE
jgi:hypothetical protein